MFHFQLCSILINLTSFHLQAFELLCDLLVLYSKTSAARSTPALQTLVHLPSQSLRSDMAAFLVDYVFSDTDNAEHNGQHTLYLFV